MIKNRGEKSPLILDCRSCRWFIECECFDGKICKYMELNDMKKLYIETEEHKGRVNGTVLLNCYDIIVGGKITLFICDKRQASDTLIKLSINPIFKNLKDISCTIKNNVYFIEIESDKDFKIIDNILGVEK